MLLTDRKSDKLNILAVVPARGGSKGIPGKNLRKIGGLPLVDHTIKFAKQLSNVDGVILTSDSSSILQRGEKYNIFTVNRPKELASDESLVIESIKHAVAIYDQRNQVTTDSVILLQPTYPFRLRDDVEKAISKHVEGDSIPVISIKPMKENPCECIVLDTKDNWSYLVSPPQNANRQNYPSCYYFITGNFYISSMQSLNSYNSFMTPNSSFFRTKERIAIDIDLPEDFILAENIFSLTSSLGEPSL
ncbi:acylneuraminate cytidylyltransferase family protein [Prochlorococcus sp. MIT 1307]|uniref:acylneuraminate cytidylyltransferase family protein n=1 Tax=Prochlorococcus sp. MIT 1307 TaxID=3096219 RepID=UPI002A755134|nr:acylneuraminate cytidylyltransferase family protein [Prochlorococcus sp. MIT 1307]